MSALLSAQVSYDQTVELSFQGVQYQIHAFVSGDTLHVHV